MSSEAKIRFVLGRHVGCTNLSSNMVAMRLTSFHRAKPYSYFFIIIKLFLLKLCTGHIALSLYWFPAISAQWLLLQEVFLRVKTSFLATCPTKILPISPSRYMPSRPQLRTRTEKHQLVSVYVITPGLQF